MNREAPLTLAEEIAYIAEAAYRRGFQQGHLCYHRKDCVNINEIQEWRFNKDIADDHECYLEAVPPPFGNRKHSSARNRLDMEITGRHMPLLKYVLKK